MIHVEDAIPGHLVALHEHHVLPILRIDVGDAPLVPIHIYGTTEGLHEYGGTV
jgi:hypothetical protein